MFLFLILGVLVGILAVVFAVQNIVPVTVMFLAWEFHGSMAFIIAAAIVAGLLISIFVSIPEVVENFFVLKTLRKKNQDLEAEVAHYKNVLGVTVTSGNSVTASDPTESLIK